MIHKFLISSLFFVLILISSCQSSKQATYLNPDNWVHLTKANDVDIFADTTSILREGSAVYAREKRVFTTPESKALYTDKIRNAYTQMGKAEKADKWNDFSYCIYYSLYECTNQRFRVLWVEDYDSTGKRIARTAPHKNKIEWLKVENETVGDYTFFYICDFGN